MIPFNPEDVYVKGVVLVRFKDGTTEEQILSLMQLLKLKILEKKTRRTIGKMAIYKIEVPEKEEQKWAEEIKKSELVAEASLNYIYKIN